MLDLILFKMNLDKLRMFFLFTVKYDFLFYWLYKLFGLFKFIPLIIASNG